MGNLCKLSECCAEASLPALCCPPCLPGLDRISPVRPPIGICCSAPVPLLPRDLHSLSLLSKTRSFRVTIKSRTEYIFALRRVRTILCESAFWLPAQRSGKEEFLRQPSDRLASHINSKYVALRVEVSLGSLNL